MIYQYIDGLIEQALKANIIEQGDKIYVRNQVMNLLHVETFPGNNDPIIKDTIPNILERIIAYAIEKSIISDVLDEKEILSANIMNCFVSRPSTINAIFNKKYLESPIAATDYFYNLSKHSNYIQAKRIKKNVSYQVDTVYGALDITINLSKPEKDPEHIKREGAINQTENYPECLLCTENEGYTGRIGYPARANHRIIKVPLLNENWFFQYSPYAYYNEHSILLAEEHRDMKIDKKAFERLLTFTEKFPHYFIGSNADLPIVGGSILNHDHYQAGQYEFAMTNAVEAFSFALQDHQSINASVLNWPLSVIRLKGVQLKSVAEAANHILLTWRNYSDERSYIFAFSGDTPHNTITPIARNRDGVFELDLVLRNNRTSAEHPFGIFHPHADVHHVKKENIGLIEVMGLAVLPPRLKDELEEIKKFLLGCSNDVEVYHQDWANQLWHNYGKLPNAEQADDIMQKELGKKFMQSLEDSGVFKERSAFERFIQELNE